MDLVAMDVAVDLVAIDLAADLIDIPNMDLIGLFVNIIY